MKFIVALLFALLSTMTACLDIDNTIAPVYRSSSNPPASPHWGAVNVRVSDEGYLTATYQVKGLGPSPTIRVTVSASADADYACVDSNNIFLAGSDQHVTGQLIGTATTDSVSGGQIESTLWQVPPRILLTCLSNEKLTLVKVTYDDVLLSEPYAGDLAIAGPITKSWIAPWTPVPM